MEALKVIKLKLQNAILAFCSPHPLMVRLIASFSGNLNKKQL